MGNLKKKNDEFTILLPETNIKGVFDLSKRLEESITCSFGVTGYKDGEDIDDFIKRFEDVLYKAK